MVTVKALTDKISNVKKKNIMSGDIYTKLKDFLKNQYWKYKVNFQIMKIRFTLVTHRLDQQ